MPFVAVGGMFVALKAENSADELDSSRAMIKTLGGEVENKLSVPLPMSDITRELIVIRKVSETPKKFPRRADKIKKSASGKA